jgi:hypothetical protein
MRFPGPTHQTPIVYSKQRDTAKKRLKFFRVLNPECESTIS